MSASVIRSMNLSFRKSNSTNQDFIDLVKMLDQDLAVRDGEEHDFYRQFNGIAGLNHVIVIYHEKEAIGCGAIKKYNNTIAEVKRMFVLGPYRGRRIATQLLKQLESWAKELDFNELILETGARNPEAIALYRREGYKVIENYDQYIGMDNSICFGKPIP